MIMLVICERLFVKPEEVVEAQKRSDAILWKVACCGLKSS